MRAKKGDAQTWEWHIKDTDRRRLSLTNEVATLLAHKKRMDPLQLLRERITSPPKVRRCSATRLIICCQPDRRPARGGVGNKDLWVTTRVTKGDPWGEPVNLGPIVNSSSNDATPSISPDVSTLFFWSGRPAGFGHSDLWRVSIEPVIDLNGDGIVDCVDMCIMVDRWHTDEPSCDIGQTALVVHHNSNDGCHSEPFAALKDKLREESLLLRPDASPFGSA